jgi:hypothetical protein
MRDIISPMNDFIYSDGFELEYNRNNKKQLTNEGKRYKISKNNKL